MYNGKNVPDILKCIKLFILKCIKLFATFKKKMEPEPTKRFSYDLEKWFRCVRYLFYQAIDEKIKTWTLRFPAKGSSLNQPKPTSVCIRSTNLSNHSISARLLFLRLFCSRVFISRSYENGSIRPATVPGRDRYWGRAGPFTIGQFFSCP